MKTWHYLNNPFLMAAQKSSRKALKISSFYNAQLLVHSGDAFFAPLYANYHPLHLELNAAYSKREAQGGTLKGNTLGVKELLQQLSPAKLNGWEHAVLGLFDKGSPEYAALFPRKRRPFNSGGKEMRIAAVAQLGKSLEGNAALASTKTDVDNFHTKLTADRQIQLGSKGSTETKSAALETAISAAMTAMHGDFGLLIHKYQTNPRRAEAFFDIATIRRHDQLIFKKTVKTAKNRTILQRTFAADDSITLINDGLSALQFFLAPASRASREGLTVLEVFPNSRQTVDVTQLGDISNRYLHVFNAGIHDGHCIVELL